ncbi:HTH domain-containing protein [Marinicella pacifica]
MLINNVIFNYYFLDSVLIDACFEEGALKKTRNTFGAISERVRNEFGIKVEETFKLINKHPEYSAEKMAEKLGVTSRTVENHQAKLKKAGYIERKGDNLGGHWIIVNK